MSEDGVIYYKFDTPFTILYKTAEIYGIFPFQLIDGDEVGEYGLPIYLPLKDYLDANLEEDNVGDIYQRLKSRPNFSLEYFGYELFNKDETYFQQLLEHFEEVPSMFKGRQIEERLEQWFNKMETYTSRDYEKILDEIKMNQERLSKFDSDDLFAYSPFILTSLILNFSNISFRQQDNKYDISPQLGKPIFRDSVCSEYFPYIHYIDSNEAHYYKIYRGNKLDVRPDYAALIPKVKDRKDVIYAILWLGNPGENIIKESLRLVTLSLAENLLTVSIPIVLRGKQTQNQEIAEERIRQAFPSLSLETTENPKVIMETRLYADYDLSIDESIFMHLILNDTLYSRHLYMEEFITPWPLKKRLHLHYRPAYTDYYETVTESQNISIVNSATVSVKLRHKIAKKGEIVAMKGSRGFKNIKLKQDYHYLQLNMQAASEEVLADFLRVFASLMTLYYFQDSQGKIAAIYNKIFAKVDRSKIKAKSDIEDVQASGKKKMMSELRNMFPDVFVKEYATIGTEKIDVIKPEDFKQWKSQNPNQQILPFPAPPEETMFYFTCPGRDGKTFYPGVTQNNLPNRGLYEYIPKCYRNDQMGRVNYRTYYGGEERGVSSSSYNIKITSAILPLGEKAEISINLDYILDPEKKFHLFRNGVVHDSKVPNPNSLIYCALIATGHPEFIELKTAKERRKFVEKFRANLNDKFYPGLIYQEIFEPQVQNSAVVGDISNSEVYFDPKLYYRIIEEIFNINLYVFDVPYDGSPEDIDIPRNRYLHLRPYRRRKTMIVLKHFGGKVSRKSPFPQCELLSDYDDQNKYLFGDDMTQRVHQIFARRASVISWSPISSRDIRGYDDPFNVFDPLTYFGKSLKGQWIDPFGKLRALVVRFQREDVTLMIPPSQPLNLPLVDIETLPKVDILTARNFLGDDNYTGNSIDGTVAWFSAMGLEHHTAILLEDNDPGDAPANPLLIKEEGELSMSHLTELRKKLSILMSILKWAYNLVRSEMPVRGFVENYFHRRVNSRLDYDFSQLLDVHPIIENIDDLISYLADKTNMIRDGKFYFSSTSMKQKIQQQLEIYHRHTEGLEIVNPSIVDENFVKESDFDYDSNVIVLIGKSELEEFLETDDRMRKPIPILSKLHQNDFYHTYPMIFRDDDDIVYMIQNARSGRIERALDISERWRQEKVNGGPDTRHPFADDENVYAGASRPHVIFGINESGNFYLISNNTFGNTSFEKVVQYQIPDDDGNVVRLYGAILDLD